MAEKNNTVILLVSTTILVILAVAFLASISDTTLTTTQKLVVADEVHNLTAISCYVTGTVNESASACTFLVTNAPTSWKQEDCPLASVVLTNSTGTELTLDTDYTLTASTGSVAMLNTTETEAANIGATGVLVDYTYCGDNYMSSSWGRSILNVNVGLYAIAILIAVVLVVYLLLGKQKDDD